MEAWRLSEEDSDSSDSDSDAESVLERCPCKERLSGSSVARAPNEGRAGGLGEVGQCELSNLSKGLRIAPRFGIAASCASGGAAALALQLHRLGMAAAFCVLLVYPPRHLHFGPDVHPLCGGTKEGHPRVQEDEQRSNTGVPPGAVNREGRGAAVGPSGHLRPGLSRSEIQRENSEV